MGVCITGARQTSCGAAQHGAATVLLSCGSFNPPTVMHLRMFDLAIDALRQVLVLLQEIAQISHSPSDLTCKADAVTTRSLHSTPFQQFDHVALLDKPVLALAVLQSAHMCTPTTTVPPHTHPHAHPLLLFKDSKDRRWQVATCRLWATPMAKQGWPQRSTEWPCAGW
jgi:hypothetical protein